MKKSHSSEPESDISGIHSVSGNRLQTGILIGWVLLIFIVILVAAALSRIISSDLSANELNAAQSEALRISDAWIRATPPGATTAAAYLVIENLGVEEDQLLDVRSNSAITVEIHTTRKQSGLMRMSTLEALKIPGRTKVALAPGEVHIMFIDITHRFEPGDTELLTLFFEKAGPQQVSFVTRDTRSEP